MKIDWVNWNRLGSRDYFKKFDRMSQRTNFRKSSGGMNSQKTTVRTVGVWQRSLKTSQTLQRFLLWCVFLVTTWLESLIFKLEPTKPSKYCKLLGMENFACKVYWFQNSAAVYWRQKVPKEYSATTTLLSRYGKMLMLNCQITKWDPCEATKGLVFVCGPSNQSINSLNLAKITDLGRLLPV